MFALLRRLLPFSLHLLSSPNLPQTPQHLINLYSAGLSSNLLHCFPLVLWPLSSLPPQISGLPTRKPLKVMFYYSFHWVFSQLLYTLLPTDIHTFSGSCFILGLWCFSSSDHSLQCYLLWYAQYQKYCFSEAVINVVFKLYFNIWTTCFSAQFNFLGRETGLYVT